MIWWRLHEAVPEVKVDVVIDGKAFEDCLIDQHIFCHLGAFGLKKKILIFDLINFIPKAMIIFIFSLYVLVLKKHLILLLR